MSIVQFFRILIARRIVIAAALIAAIVLATSLCFILKPRYPATARVLMDVIKPDPISGQVISSSFARGYTKTQIELITDYRVAGDVVDKLGFDRDPLKATDFREHSNGTEDFNRYEARKIIEATDAKLVEDSNILEISYSSSDPILSRNVVTALRSAYLDASSRFRTDAARRSADWYVDQASKARDALSSAESAKSTFERTNGIVMAPDGTDSETMKLDAMQRAMLSARSAAGMVEGSADLSAIQSPPVATLKAQLNAVDDQLAEATQRLGTSHPIYISLNQRRAVLVRQLAQEMALARSQGGSTVSANQSNARRLETEVTAQKVKVLGLKTKLDELSQLQREVDLRRSQYAKAAERTADLKLQSDLPETGLVPLGDAVVSGMPTFPKKPLIMGLGTVGGLAVGLVLAVLAELFSRRIRGPEDLAYASNVAVLAVIAGSEPSNLWHRLLRFFYIGHRGDAARDRV